MFFVVVQVKSGILSDIFPTIIMSTNDTCSKIMGVGLVCFLNLSISTSLFMLPVYVGEISKLPTFYVGHAIIMHSRTASSS